MNEIEANQAFGWLNAGFNISAYSFELAMGKVVELLKTGGWKLAGKGYTDVNAFVADLRLDQFRIIADRRREFIERVKELQPEVSNRTIAGALGVSPDTVNRDVERYRSTVARKGPENGEARERYRPPGAGDGRRDATILVQRDTREERREEKLASIGKAAALSGRFSVFYADPPWRDEFGSSPRQTELHYPVMDLDAIKALPVAEISAADAALYLWALPHMFHKALEVMAAWGFEYRTCATWTKDKIGLGRWFRNQTEHLLVGRRGEFPPPAEDVRSSSWINAPLGRHSAKPDVFIELIERWYPDQPKIELFRRGPARPAWSAWGNEAEAAQ